MLRKKDYLNPTRAESDLSPYPRPLLTLVPDPDGFLAMISYDGGITRDRYRPGMAPQSRAWWRIHAKENGFKLRERRTK